MKMLFDLLPVILFFVAYKLGDIYLATGVAIVASVVQIGWLKLRRQPVDNMQWVSLGIIVVFGGLTLLLKDETFIKWKPTVLYGLFAVALLVSRYAFGRNLIEAAMGKQVRLPAPVWDRLNLSWTAFFAVLGVLNILIAYRFSTDVWVNFKLFGSLGLTVLFVIGQAMYFSRHVQEDA
ncbi:septation protein A [Quisquiliibacterium transsilvanicum]|uniref:Inner membrane-spanning protein YciB n=1 Tax=Quisquiliibacterium transsilvanicum TaxID=1549638 RepID=A0A7W8HED3_9BURK|nr:septation protein A [Quisquiliibacterium transsilvanicum]MBB5270421.1 intracellular septation protein [Quisquiliibacterium transsilvanicum]